MRGWFVCLCFWALAASVFGQSEALHARRMAGGDYISLGEIIAHYRLQRGQLLAERDRRDIRLLGVQHWLSAPVVEARGGLWISSRDLLKTVDPVLRQGRSRTPSPVRLVVLDPGHGGSDTGTRGRRSVEKTMTLDLARRVERYLEAAGIRVVLTRGSDKTLGLAERVALAGSKRADLFISLHFNAGGSAEGIETYCVPPAGAVSTANPFRRLFEHPEPPCAGNQHDERNVWLAHCVQRAALSATGAADRGVRRARFLVLRDAPCPAILIEGGFLSNRAEEQRILGADYRDRLARAIADGVLGYKRTVE